MCFVFAATVGGASAQLSAGLPLNEQDNPINLIGNYMCPSGITSGSVTTGGKAWANTDPGLRAGFNNVSEINAGTGPVTTTQTATAPEEGTFTPFNDFYNWPAELVVDLANRAWQVELDTQFPRDNHDHTATVAGVTDTALDRRAVAWTPNAQFYVGVGNDIASTTGSPAQIRVTAVGGGLYLFELWSNGTVTTIGTSTSSTQTQFRMRMNFDGAGANVVVTITAMNGTGAFTNDIVTAPILLTAGTVRPQAAVFTAGWLTATQASTTAPLVQSATRRAAMPCSPSS